MFDFQPDTCNATQVAAMNGFKNQFLQRFDD